MADLSGMDRILWLFFSFLGAGCDRPLGWSVGPVNETECRKQKKKKISRPPFLTRARFFLSPSPCLQPGRFPSTKRARPPILPSGCSVSLPVLHSSLLSLLWTFAGPLFPSLAPTKEPPPEEKSLLAFLRARSSRPAFALPVADTSTHARLPTPPDVRLEGLPSDCGKKSVTRFSIIALATTAKDGRSLFVFAPKSTSALPRHDFIAK